MDSAQQTYIRVRALNTFLDADTDADMGANTDTNTDAHERRHSLRMGSVDGTVLCSCSLGLWLMALLQMTVGSSDTRLTPV